MALACSRRNASLLSFSTMAFPEKLRSAVLSGPLAPANYALRSGIQCYVWPHLPAEIKEPARQAGRALSFSATMFSSQPRNGQRRADVQRARPVAGVGVGNHPPFGRVACRRSRRDSRRCRRRRSHARSPPRRLRPAWPRSQHRRRRPPPAARPWWLLRLRPWRRLPLRPSWLRVRLLSRRLPRVRRPARPPPPISVMRPSSFGV